MSAEKPSTKAAEPTRKSSLELSNEDTHRFFLKPENYCSLDLPEYIAFGNPLIDVAQILNVTQQSEIKTTKN